MQERQRIGFVAVVDLGGAADADRDREDVDVVVAEEIDRQVAGLIDDDSDAHGES